MPIKDRQSFDFQADFDSQLRYTPNVILSQFKIHKSICTKSGFIRCFVRRDFVSDDHVDDALISLHEMVSVTSESREKIVRLIS